MGNYVRLTNYADENLFHDQPTGCSVTGILHLVYKNPVYWYSTKQITVETATYGSEFLSPYMCGTDDLFEEYYWIPLCTHPPEKIHVWR